MWINFKIFLEHGVVWVKEIKVLNAFRESMRWTASHNVIGIVVFVDNLK